MERYREDRRRAVATPSLRRCRSCPSAAPNPTSPFRGDAELLDLRGVAARSRQDLRNQRGRHRTYSLLNHLIAEHTTAPTPRCLRATVRTSIPQLTKCAEVTLTSSNNATREDAHLAYGAESAVAGQDPVLCC